MNKTKVNQTSAQKIAEEWLDREMSILVDRLLDIRGRFDATQSILGSVRVKRGLFDAGGSALNWLFGTATETETRALQEQLSQMQVQQKGMLTVMKHQASVVGEAVWTLNRTQRGLQLLDIKYNQISGKFMKMSSDIELLFAYISAESAFNIIATELDTYSQVVSDLESGLATLAAGKSPSQLFPPAQLLTVIQHVAAALPPNWRLAMQEHNELNVWDVYREARVSTASLDFKLQLFIELPVVEDSSSFTLYRVHSFPQPREGGGAELITELPTFLAVLEKQEHFIDRFFELSISDAGDCSNSRHRLCHFHSSIGRGESKSSCALSLFSSDHVGQEKCQRAVVKTEVSTTLYVGLGTWVLSLVGGPMVLKCPTQPASTVYVPKALTIITLPPGCSGKTKEWVLPAVFKGSNRETSAKLWITVTDPPLWFAPRSTIGSSSTSTQTPLSSGPATGDLLNRITQDQAEIDRLQEAQKYVRPNRYPWEWISAILIPILGFGLVAHRFHQVEIRLKALGGTDAAPYRPGRPRLRFASKRTLIRRPARTTPTTRIPTGPPPPPPPRASTRVFSWRARTQPDCR